MNDKKNTTANKYLINQDLIRFSSQRRKMPFEKMKRGDCFWVIGHEKIATKFQDEQHVWPVWKNPFCRLKINVL